MMKKMTIAFDYFPFTLRSVFYSSKRAIDSCYNLGNFETPSTSQDGSYLNLPMSTFLRKSVLHFIEVGEVLN